VCVCGFTHGLCSNVPMIEVEIQFKATITTDAFWVPITLHTDGKVQTFFNDKRSALL